jgi:type II pantothenate kinase
VNLLVSIDFGLTHTKVVVLDGENIRAMRTLPSHTRVMNAQHVSRVLREVNQAPSDFSKIFVTGSRSSRLSDVIGETQIVRVNEVDAIGRGGLALVKRSGHTPMPKEALVVSAGSGTAMIAANASACRHVSGTAVGGGTLQGLGWLLLDTNDAQEIDRLAKNGDATKVDLTLLEAIGGSIGKLPSDTSAVNFGKLANGDSALAVSRENIAAGLVNMVGQVIAMIAISVAKAEKLDTIIVVGFLPSLPSVSEVLFRVADYYGANLVVPPDSGYATALGATMH